MAYAATYLFHLPSIIIIIWLIIIIYLTTYTNSKHLSKHHMC